jgi:hypothetical protein
MKGTFFIKPIELNLDITGESWSQGDTVSGELKIKNYNSSKEDLLPIGCHLCFCNKKKLKAKDQSAIKVIDSIDNNNTNSIAFNFKLPSDCSITDSTNGYFLISGNINQAFTHCGILEIEVTPTSELLSFVEVFEQFFRFKFKKFKNKKDVIEAVITPPETNEWASIQKLTVQLSMSDNSIKANFNCSLKKIAFDNSLSKTKDEKKEINILITKKEYELYGSTNQDSLRAIIQNVLNEFKIKPII